MGLVHSRDSRSQVALDRPPLPMSQMLRGGRKAIGRLSYRYALCSQLWELWASVCFFFFPMILSTTVMWGSRESKHIKGAEKPVPAMAPAPLGFCSSFEKQTQL